MHDANGKELKVGDKVNIPCIVTSFGEPGPYCNINVELVHPMPAYPDQKSTMSAINTRQVEKAE